MKTLHASPLFAALLLVGCGGTTTGTSKQFDDASTGSGGTGGAASSSGGSRATGGSGGTTTLTEDAGNLACGSARCSATEICFHPECDCIVLTVPRTDAGTCPGSSRPEGDGGVCHVPLSCPPFCADPGGDGGVYWCTGRDGTLSGLVTGPIPIGMSRVCYGMCV